MKMSLTINEEFGSADALFEFATKLAVIFKLPADSFMKLAASVSAAPKTSHPAAETARAEAPAGLSAGEIPAAVFTPGTEAEHSNGGSVNVSEAVSPNPVPPQVSPVPPADVAPRTRRGRPKSDANARTAAEAPKANAYGASGVVADVTVAETPAPASAPSNPAPSELAAAADAGSAAANEGSAFQTACLEFVAADQETYKAVLVEFNVKSPRAVPVEKRAAFLARCRERFSKVAA